VLEKGDLPFCGNDADGFHGSVTHGRCVAKPGSAWEVAHPRGGDWFGDYSQEGGGENKLFGEGANCRQQKAPFRFPERGLERFRSD
jgi:hypothetical protein